MKAMATVEIAAVTSQPMLLKLYPYADPLSPINCAADKLVSSKDPAINTEDNPLPAKK